MDVASGTFAQSASPQKAVSNAYFAYSTIFDWARGAGVVGNPHAALFKLTPMNNLGEYVWVIGLRTGFYE